MGVWFQLGTRCQKTLLMATSVWNSLGSAGKWTEYQIVKGGTTTLKKTCQDNRTNTRKGGLQICMYSPSDLVYWYSNTLLFVALKCPSMFVYVIFNQSSSTSDHFCGCCIIPYLHWIVSTEQCSEYTVLYVLQVFIPSSLVLISTKTMTRLLPVTEILYMCKYILLYIYYIYIYLYIHTFHTSVRSLQVRTMQKTVMHKSLTDYMNTYTKHARN